MKISVIGGGSSYTPELVDGFIEKSKAGEIKIDKLFLMDIDKNRLKIVGEFVKFMVEKRTEKSPCKFEVVLTDDLKEAISGADFVITQFRVGKNVARNKDLIIAKKWGVVGQETTGVGGFAKALRTIPVIIDIIKIMEKFSPQAYLINFTNPVSIISQLIGNYSSLKWLGLCNVPKHLSMSIAELLGEKDDSNIYLDYIGLNHLSWVRRVFLNKKDVTNEVIRKYIFQTKGFKLKNIPEEYFLPEVLESLGMIPSPYLVYYYNQTAIIEKEKKEKKNRAQKVMEIEKRLFKIYKEKKTPQKPKLLSERGGAYYSIIAVELISAIVNDKNESHIINTLNNGSFTDLPDNVSIETNCVIGKDKIIPEKKGELPLSVKGLIYKVKAYETLTIEAALEKSKKKAFLALLNHPLIPDSLVAKNILEDVLKANREFIGEYK